MRIHSDSVDILEVRKAARLAGVTFNRLDEHGSRKRKGAFDIKLNGSGTHMISGCYGAATDEQAATWDEWGIFLGHLYRLDERLVTPYYLDAEHYVWTTGGRFTVDFTPAHQHRRHNWKPSGDSVTGVYHVSQCGGGTGCSTVRRHMAYGHDFAEISGVNA